MKLNPTKIGLTCGLLWGTSLVLLILPAMFFPPYGTNFITTIASVYPGYSISWTGMAIGFVYGFIDWFIGGVIFAWLYNYINNEK